MKEQINLEEIAKKTEELKKKVGGKSIESTDARFGLREIEEKVKSGEIEESAREDYENWQKKRADLAESIKQAVLDRTDKTKFEAELNALDAEYYGESKEGFENKSIFKKGYYAEFKPFLDGLPEELSVPKNVVEKKDDNVMTEEEMTKGHTPFEKNEAFGLAAKLKKEGKNGIVWFKDEGELCGVDVYNRGSRVNVRKSGTTSKWSEGDVSYFRD